MNQLTPAQNQDVLQERAHSILDYCKAFEIVDDQDYQMADHKVVECKNLMKVIKLHHDPVCDATNKAHKAATALRKNLYDPPDKASRILATKMGNYKQQRDAEKLEEQRLLDEKAKEEHDADCEKQAQEMEERGEPNVAQTLREMKDEPPVTQQLTEQPLMSKTKFRKDWEITKIFMGLVPDEYLTVDEAAIMRMIRAKKGATKIPGVEFKEIDVPIRRAE